jgi:hypothetical protein
MTIGSTLNSIDQSLLNEIRSYQPNSKTTGTNSTDASVSDQVGISQAAQLFKDLEQLQSSNPAEFKQVLTDGAAKLRDAAKQETDPAKAAFLNKLADGFQNAANTGDLSSAGPSSSYAPRGHHHHRHPAADGDSSLNLAANILSPSQT